jgi:hypothetical protein
MIWFAAHMEQFGAILVFLGLLVSMFLGTPASRVDSSERQIGWIENEKQRRKHDALTFVAPAISGVGAICYIVAAFIR